MLSHEFLSQFKTGTDVSKFLNVVTCSVFKEVLDSEMGIHLVYEKNSVTGNNSGNSHMVEIPTKRGEAVISSCPMIIPNI